MARPPHRGAHCSASVRRRTCLSASSSTLPPAMPLMFLGISGVLLLISVSCLSSAFVVPWPTCSAGVGLRRAPLASTSPSSTRGRMCGFTSLSCEGRTTSTKQVNLARVFPVLRRPASRVAAATGEEGEGLATAIGDLDLEGFEDLSGGRGTCLKKVEEPGDPNQGNPSKGSKVTVHYAMRILGGSELGASRTEERGKPFQFILGRWPSEAIHGWDKAVSAMLMGEVATLICGPQYAFGKKGAPPRIPPNATIETKLELVDWVDLAATYNAKPGQQETDQERMARYRNELEDGTSPMRAEAGLHRRVQQEMAMKGNASADGTTDHTGRKIYDIKSEEARKILSKQKIQGYTRNFGYIETANYVDLYIPVPKGTKAKQVTCEIHPDRMTLSVEGVGVVAEGEFQGKVILDGCYWLMTDLSLDTPPGLQDRPASDLVRQGPVYRGETCVQVFLEKRKPFDTLWENLFVSVQKSGEDEGGKDNRQQQGAEATDEEGVGTDAIVVDMGR